MPAQDQVGLTGPSYDVYIERGKIREFARAMYAPIPDFTDGPRAIIPATFLVCAPYTFGYSLERPRGTVFEQIDHDLSVSLHATEEFRFNSEPPRAGDQLTAHATLEKVWDKPGKNAGTLNFLTVLTEYRDESGAIAVEQRSTSVTTTRAPGEGDWEIEIPRYQPDYDALDPGDPFQDIPKASWEDLTEGRGPGPVNTGPLMLRDIVRFQGVVGEDDPLHHDYAWAQSFNYPSVFGLGTHQASVLASYAAHWVPPSTVRYFKAGFRGVVWPGDDLTYNGVATRVYRDSEGHGMAELTLDCSRSAGDVVVTATMVCRF